MKKNLSFIIIAISCALVAFSCAKEVAPIDDPAQPAGESIIISARLSDALTKVTFTPGLNGESKPMLTLTWQSTDKLRVADASDHTSYTDFDLVSGDGTNSGSFSGTPVSAASYDIWVVSENVNKTQTQASDGDTSHIKYIAQATGITDLTASINFTEVSSVLGLQVKLPAGVAATISSVELITSKNIFFTGNTLSIGITTPGDTDTDNILKLYATLPSGDQAIADGTALWVKFISTSGTKYTTYRQLGNGLSFNGGALNTIKINCTSDDDKGIQEWSGVGSELDPYLIDNKYKLQAVYALRDSELRYFKLTDDIDMNGELWTTINPITPYKPIDFDGGSHTISKLSNSMFYVFCKSSIKDLTLDDCTASDGTQRGIFTQYIQGDGAHTVTNVDVTNSTVDVGNGNMGGLIGRINNPGGGTTTATITNCDITNTSVTGKSAGTGGLIGLVESVVTVSNCNVKGLSITGQNNAVAIGGVVGKVSSASSFSGCTFDKNDATAATITGPTKTGASCSSVAPGNVYIGGIAGEVSGAATFDDCHSKNATITITTPSSNASYWKNVGGAFGYIHNADAKVGQTTGCTVEDVTIESYHFPAGFVSALDGGTIDKSSVTGLTISGQNYVGGFVSIVNTGTISNCSVTGSPIESANATVGGFASYIYGEASFEKNNTSLQIGTPSHKIGANNGGFAGQIVAAATVTDCHASGSVYTANNSTYVGGFAGLINAACEVSRCSATGSVEGGKYLGGFTGSAKAPSGKILTISECYYSSGTVTSTTTGADSYVGGLIGLTYDSGTVNVTNCYVSGNVTGPGKWAGGILGSHYKGTANLTNCYATGSVQAGIGAGGIVAYVNAANLSVVRCMSFNSGIHATNSDGSEHESSGAIIGYANGKKLVCNVSYRPDSLTSNFSDCSGNSANVIEQHSFISSANTIPQRQGLTYGYYHHGRRTAYTLCNLVHSGAIGEDWSDTIWDWSGSRPVLNNNKETL